MPLLGPFRSKIGREAANAWLRNPKGETRPAAGQDTEAEPVVCLVSMWEKRRSKEAHSGLAIALQGARPKQALKRIPRQTS